MTESIQANPNALPARKVAFWALAAVVFSMPWENMLMLKGVGTISRMLGILAVLTAVFSLFLSKTSRPVSTFLGISFAYIFFVTSSFFWSMDAEASLTYIISICQLYVFLWLIWEFVRDETDQNRIMAAYILGAYVSCISTFKAYFSGVEITYLRYSARGFDPNDLALILALGVPMAWWLFMKENEFLKTCVFGMYIPCASLAIVLSASRASFLALSVTLLLIVLTFKTLNLRKKIAVALISFVGVVVIVLFSPSSSWSRLLTTFYEIKHGTLNSRAVIWKFAIESFSDNMIFGVGAGNFPFSIQQILGSSVSSHNLMLSILVEFGIFGFILFLSLVFYCVFSIKNLKSDERKMWIILVLALFVGTLSLEWVLRKPTWFLLALVAARTAAPYACDSDPSLEAQES